MSESPESTDAEHPAGRPVDRSGARSSDPPVIVAVVRSGGIAGISRRWRVEIEAPDSTDAQSWIALIERCPWNDDVEGSTGADRYVWSIRARTPSERRERELPDAALSGAWRDLVDAVRAASA